MNPRLKQKKPSQHQPALLPELPGPQTQLTQKSAHQPGDGEHPCGGYQHHAGDKAGEQKGAVLSHLGNHQHEHRPNQDGINKVGGKPHIGTDAAYQHKDKADGDAHRSQRAGGDGVLCCQLPFSLFQ